MKISMHLVLLMAGVLFIVGLALGTPPLNLPVRATGLANADDRTQIAHGHRLHVQYCASCHGARLQGQFGWRVRAADGRMKAPPHDASGHMHEHSDAELLATIQNGAGVGIDMPRYAGVLSDRDAMAIIAYIKSTWPLAVRIAQAAANPDRAGMPKAVLTPELAVAQLCLASQKRPNTAPKLPPTDDSVGKSQP